MANAVKYSISIEPLEELTDVNGSTHNIIASEVGRTLGGSGSAGVVLYNATPQNQGYKDAAVNYKEALDGAGQEERCSSETTATLVFIRNTGYEFSSATVLGAVESSRLLKVTVNSGAIIIAVLGAGEVIVLKALAATGTIDASDVKVETVDSDGSEAADGVHLAVEYLVVD